MSTHFSKLLDLREVVIDDVWVVVLKVFGELGDVVYLDPVPQTGLVVKAWTQSADLAWGFRKGCAHSPARGDVSVEITLVKPLDGELLFLFEWEIIEGATDSKLAVDVLLGDVEVLDVEEALLANGSDEGACELLLALRCGVEGEVDGDQVGPVKVGLQSRVLGV